MGTSSKLLHYFLLSTNLVSLNIATIIAIAFAIAVYSVVIVFMKIDDINILLDQLKKRFRNGKDIESNNIDDLND